MNKLVRDNRHWILISIISCTLLGLAGCSKELPATTPDEAKAFAGDPAKKAQAGAAMREQAMRSAAQDQAAAQARDRQQRATAPAPAPPK